MSGTPAASITGNTLTTMAALTALAIGGAAMFFFAEDDAEDGSSSSGGSTKSRRHQKPPKVSTAEAYEENVVSDDDEDDVDGGEGGVDIGGSIAGFWNSLFAAATESEDDVTATEKTKKQSAGASGKSKTIRRR